MDSSNNPSPSHFLAGNSHLGCKRDPPWLEPVLQVVAVALIKLRHGTSCCSSGCYGPRELGLSPVAKAKYKWNPRIGPCPAAEGAARLL